MEKINMDNGYWKDRGFGAEKDINERHSISIIHIKNTNCFNIIFDGLLGEEFYMRIKLFKLYLPSYHNNSTRLEFNNLEEAKECVDKFLEQIDNLKGFL